MTDTIDLKPIQQFWDEFKRRASRALSPDISVRPHLMLSWLNGSESLAGAFQNLVERLEAEEWRQLQQQINAHALWNVIYERVGRLSTYFWTYIIRSQQFCMKLVLERQLTQIRLSHATVNLSPCVLGIQIESISCKVAADTVKLSSDLHRCCQPAVFSLWKKKRRDIREN